MNWNKRPGLELMAIFVMIVVVSILGVLQYLWTAEISRTEQGRLKNSLDTSVKDFDQEFSYDFQKLCESFEMNPEENMPALEASAANRYSTWIRINSHPGLVAGVYLLKTVSPGNTQFAALNEGDKRFHNSPWPSQLNSLRPFLLQPEKRQDSAVDDRVAVYFPWAFYDETPALVRPVFQIVSDDKTHRPAAQPIGFLVVLLNPDIFEQQYFADLVDRHFGNSGQSNFVVSIRTSKAPFHTVYLSDATFPMTSSSPDAQVNLFDLVNDEARRRGHAPVQPADRDRQWQLVVQHAAGSLGDVVASWRRRNLAISFGLLAVLAGAIALIFSVTRREKALARMQMEFVAGVSHELCTPLAVINSAAENLVDGVVDSNEQMQEYGGIIRGQGRRLERLVDEVLLFTAGRFGLSGYDLMPLEVDPIISQSMAASESILRESGFTVEKKIDSRLPLILADPAAVITCIENLVSNAIKYSNSSRSITIRAVAGSSGPAQAKPEVRIGVEDKGIGIPAADLPHIFEPFYRGQSVRDNHIRGVGLGLYLVRRMMEDMGGRVSVTSESGKGTAVVLHFPAEIHGEHIEPEDS